MLSMLSEDDYRAASFLDQRIITPELKRQVLQWNALEAVGSIKRPSPHYIFHIGHVGSTLISRLLGELPEVLALREPQILRDLTDITMIKDQPHSPWSPETYATRRDLIVSWLSRTFNTDQRAMIKASSFVSEVAGELINASNKSLFLYTPLNSYLETILAGDGSRQEAEQLAGLRLTRLNKRLDSPAGKLWELSHGQRIALGWLCEMSTLMEAYENADQQLICWQDFDAFLIAPTEELLKIAAHFDLNLSTEKADALISGPIMSTYSKAPEHDYSPDLRRQLLEQARQNFRSELAKTVDWVAGLAKSHPRIETIVNFSNNAV